jgi:hypothetical protein
MEILREDKIFMDIFDDVRIQAYEVGVSRTRKEHALEMLKLNATRIKQVTKFSDKELDKLIEEAKLKLPSEA